MFMLKWQNKEQIGFFLKRNNVVNVKVKGLLQELSILLLEANIIKESIRGIQAKQLSMFDCAVGDWKCQTRTSMILDLMQDEVFLDQELLEEMPKINIVIVKIQELCEKVKHYDPTEQQQLTKELQKLSLHEYFMKNQLNYNVSEDLMLLNLCFFNTLQNHKLSMFTNQDISINKMQKLFKASKKALCELSINYEQCLAQVYGSFDEQKMLTQIELKSFCSMTSSFSSAKSIFQKMKKNKQQFVTNNIIFCACGGVQSTKLQFFILKNNVFMETSIVSELNQVVMVINSYQFPGSLQQLQTILQISSEEPFIPKEYYQLCRCMYPSSSKESDCIEEAIMAFFAQHPQYTNNVGIDFEGLGLNDSDLKKEYEHLLTLQGFNRHNMSIFHIDHIYASTLELVAQEQQAVIQSLVSAQKNLKIQNSDIVLV